MGPNSLHQILAREARSFRAGRDSAVAQRRDTLASPLSVYYITSMHLTMQLKLLPPSRAGGRHAADDGAFQRGLRRAGRCSLRQQVREQGRVAETGLPRHPPPTSASVPK